MVLNTVAVGAAVTPTVIETWCSHYLNRKPRRKKPTAHISYDVGLNLIRRFLTFASTQTVDDVQAFTSQWVPAPSWVRSRNVDIPDSFLADAAKHLRNELGPDGLEAVGGKLWWQWRPTDNKLRAEWIEMKKDYQQREKAKADCKRCMFYIHGGAYYFGSVDEHRYQIQRHARKLQAKVLAPRYRLGPQYPFPCGLFDCLAAYMYLLTIQPPETIVMAGDSAGGGMVTSLLVLLRDQGLPLPSGAILLSPWVDLTHSFPSCAGENLLDYVPSCGFMHKPSMSWPPPNSDDLKSLDELMVEVENGAKLSNRALRKRAQAQAAQSRDENDSAAGVATVSDAAHQQDDSPTPGAGDHLSLVIDGKQVEIKEQIQMYADNKLISHPLVSPVLQASLGGLPPLCVLVGGGEMLRDEQIYLAHKAAHPEAFPPPSSVDREKTNATARGSLVAGMSPQKIEEEIKKWPPTQVQLQVWDDLCHVAPTLSFTRPAKFMYRSVAQFGAWALARAQKSEIRILDDDEVSIISDDSDSEHSPPESSRKSGDDEFKHPQRSNTARSLVPKSVGKAGDPMPLFKEHMIRHRVTRYGELYPLEPESQLPALTMSPQNIGNIKTGPVRKWLAAQEQLAHRFGDAKLDFQKKRMAELAETIASKNAVFNEVKADSHVLGEESPPPTAWASRSHKQFDKIMKTRAKRRVSKGLAMWSGWGSKHDEDAIQNEEDKVKNKEDVTMSVTKVRTRNSVALGADPTTTQTKRETVPVEAVETGGSAGPAKTAAGAASMAGGAEGANGLETTTSQYPIIRSPGPRTESGIAPFKLASKANDSNPSTTTLMEHDGALGDHHKGSMSAANGKTIGTEKLNVPATNGNRSEDVSRPSTGISSDAEIQLVSAQAVPLRTAEEARREHARKSSRSDSIAKEASTRDSIMSRGRFESGMPEDPAAIAAAGEVSTQTAAPGAGASTGAGAATGSGTATGASAATGAGEGSLTIPTPPALEKRSSWAEGVIDVVRNVGSRDGPPAAGTSS